MITDHPINEIQWVIIEDIAPNDYNPNSVASKELRLLYISIKQDGFTQPIVTIWDDEARKYIIVDVYDDAEKLEDQVLFKYVVNNDNLPSAQNKNIDFVKGAVEAIDKNVVNQKKDSAIVDFLKKITCTSDGIALRTPDEIESYERDKIEDDGTVIKGALKKSCLLYKVRRQRGKEAHI